jgi:hypothetical protein
MACLKDAKEHGAAVLGVPCKATIKESEDGQFVLQTINRSRLWEIHTPQISTKETFLKGFELVKKYNLEVTDDVSVIEALGLSVKLTIGEYTNIKLTTPDDINVATQVLLDRGVTDESSFDEKEYPCISERYRDNLSKPIESGNSKSKESSPQKSDKQSKKIYF